MRIEDIKVGETYRDDGGVDVTVKCVGKRMVFGDTSDGYTDWTFLPSQLSSLPTPKPKVRLLKITWSASWKGANVYRLANGDHNRLGNAPEEPGFVGYLYADNTIRPSPTAPWLGSSSVWPSPKELESNPAMAGTARATHVVCLEVAP